MHGIFGFRSLAVSTSGRSTGRCGWPRRVPQGIRGNGLAGDAVCKKQHHGGDDQAVYAMAREDLDAWEGELGRSLANGAFGENLTTRGIDVSGALIGERRRLGPEVVLEVTSARIPCGTFQGHMDEKRWVQRFTQRGAPGACSRMIQPGDDHRTAAPATAAGGG